MTIVLGILLYMFVGGLCCGWWVRRDGILDGEDELIAIAVLAWPVGLGFEVAYRIGRAAKWIVSRKWW